MAKSTSRKTDKATLVVEIPKEMWEQLRWLSFNMKLSMAELTRRGLEHVIKQNYKKFPPPP